MLKKYTNLLLSLPLFFTPLIALASDCSDKVGCDRKACEIQNKMEIAKINGHNMPLVTQLSNGDQVEIIRSEKQTPPVAWEKIAATGKARAAIRRATRDAVRAQYKGLGERILSNTFERHDFRQMLLSQPTSLWFVTICQMWFIVLKKTSSMRSLKTLKTV